MSLSQSHIGFYSPRSFPWWPGFTVSHSPADSEVLCAVITLPTVIKTHTVWGEHFICFAMVTNIAPMKRLAQTVNLSGALTLNSPLTPSTSFWAARPCPCGHCQSASSLPKTSFGLGLQFLFAEALAENVSSSFKLFKTPSIFLTRQGSDACREILGEPCLSYILHLSRISSVSVPAHCLIFCHWALLRRVFLHLHSLHIRERNITLYFDKIPL